GRGGRRQGGGLDAQDGGEEQRQRAVGGAVAPQRHLDRVGVAGVGRQRRVVAAAVREAEFDVAVQQLEGGNVAGSVVAGVVLGEGDGVGLGRAQGAGLEYLVEDVGRGLAEDGHGGHQAGRVVLDVAVHQLAGAGQGGGVGGALQLVLGVGHPA